MYKAYFLLICLISTNSNAAILKAAKADLVLGAPIFYTFSTQPEFAHGQPIISNSGVTLHPGFVVQDKYIIGEKVNVTSEDGSATVTGKIKYDNPSITTTITNGGTALGYLSYSFIINSSDDENYNVVMKSFANFEANYLSANPQEDWVIAQGSLTITDIYSNPIVIQNFCGGVNNTCSDSYEPFGETVLSLRSNMIYSVLLTSQQQVNFHSPINSSLYIDPVFSLFDPTIQNVTFQFSDGIQNMAAPSAVPAPAAAWLFASGLPIIAAASRRRK